MGGLPLKEYAPHVALRCSELGKHNTDYNIRIKYGLDIFTNEISSLFMYVTPHNSSFCWVPNGQFVNFPFLPAALPQVNISCVVFSSLSSVGVRTSELSGNFHGP